MAKKTVKREDYLFISAFLRAREANMLSTGKAEQILDTEEFEDCAKMLADAGYPDMSHMNIRQIEETLADCRRDLFRELESMVPDREVLDLFRLKFDYHNAKVLVKSAAESSPDANLLSDSGRIPAEKLEELVREDRLNEIPGRLSAAIPQAKSLLERSANPQLADFALDKEYFEEMKSLADRLGSSFAKGYVEILADSTNLRSAVRILRMGKNIGYLHEALVPGGTVSEDRLAAAAGGEGFGALFEGSPLEKAAQLGTEAVSGASLTPFELACDNAVSAYLSNAKRRSFGEECVLGYLAGKESELTAVHMILTGKLAGIPSGTIRERLRDLYG